MEWKCFLKIPKDFVIFPCSCDKLFSLWHFAMLLLTLMSLQISLILWWFMFGNTHCFCTAEDKKVYQKVKSLSPVWLFATPWTIAYQDPPSMEFSRQEYWIGLPFPSPGYLPNPEIKPESPSLLADALPSEPSGKPCLILCPPLIYSFFPEIIHCSSNPSSIPVTCK